MSELENLDLPLPGNGKKVAAEKNVGNELRKLKSSLLFASASILFFFTFISMGFYTPFVTEKTKIVGDTVTATVVVPNLSFIIFVVIFGLAVVLTILGVISTKIQRTSVYFGIAALTTILFIIACMPIGVNTLARISDTGYVNENQFCSQITKEKYPLSFTLDGKTTCYRTDEQSKDRPIVGGANFEFTNKKIVKKSGAAGSTKVTETRTFKPVERLETD